MPLTPKNWKSFQHYKDRAPIWIKLHRALLDDFEFHCLPVASRALAPMLWLLASEYQDGTITLENRAIAFRLRMSCEEFEVALKPLIEAGFFVSSSVLLASRKQVATLETETETEIEIERHSRSVASDAPERASDERQVDLEELIAAKADPFEEFWQHFPRREGPNPRKPAESKFNALVKTGVDPKMMIEAAKKLASDEDKRGNLGTRFIPQAVTWLNQQRWSDHAAVAAMAALSPKPEMSIDAAVAMFKRLGLWSKYSPIKDISQVPADVLAKHGLDGNGKKLEEIA